MGYVVGAALVILGVLIILFGDMKVGKTGGRRYPHIFDAPVECEISKMGSRDSVRLVWSGAGIRGRPPLSRICLAAPYLPLVNGALGSRLARCRQLLEIGPRIGAVGQNRSSTRP